MKDNLTFYEKNPHSSPLSIISVPTDLGSDARGLSEAPNYLYAHGLSEMLAAIGAEIASESTVQCPEPHLQTEDSVKNLEQVAAVAEATAQAVTESLARGEVTLVLGGDHSAAIGSLRGAAAVHNSIGVIWIDAHPDAHTDETSITKNAHGMVSALAMGEGHPQLLGVNQNFIKPENFLYLGLKDFDAAEIDFLRDKKVTAFTMLEVAQRGVGPLCIAIQKLSERVDKLWISMDMDSIDKTFAPGVAMPNDAGLTLREILSLAHYIGKTCDVAGIDIVEMLPSNDLGGKTAGLALEIIALLFSNEYSWYSEYMQKYIAKTALI